MKLQNRIELLYRLKKYLQENGQEWKEIKKAAEAANKWFIPEFIDLAVNNIILRFLEEAKLQALVDHYHIDDTVIAKNTGIVMAGNIPLVGFHDFLCAFLTGHYQTIKLSAKDEILLKHLVEKMYSWETNSKEHIRFAPVLKNCDAYIATGSNNSAVYFDYYFAKYPSIIRRNRTSAAVLTGRENGKDLEKLSDDIHAYFGLGCRNVTKIYVPQDYDFVPLLQSFWRYKYFAEHNKYRNNYDYNLSLHIMNNKYYMTDNTTLLVENDSLFAPVSQLNYSYYTGIDLLKDLLKDNNEIQCIAGVNTAFGKTQQPDLMDYADGVDTIQFLLSL